MTLPGQSADYGQGLLRLRPRQSPTRARLEAAFVWLGRSAAVLVLLVSAIDWGGWASGIEALTRGFTSWPPMTPWTAVLLATLGVAILVQSGRPSRARVRVGLGLAAVAGVLAAVFLAEYAIGGSFGLDQMWFPDAVRALQSSWPGRPSPQTGLSVLLLALGVGLSRLHRRWVPEAWLLSLMVSAALPFLVVSAYLFQTLSLVRVTRSTGMGFLTAAALLLLVAAVFAVRPDRNPVAWLLARPDRWTLVRMVAVLAGPPILIGFSRLAFLNFGLREDAAWVLSISMSTVLVGAATFYLSQREQKLLIEKELLSRQRAEAEQERADAEALYHSLLEAEPDALIIVGPDGRITLANTQTDQLFGYPREQLVGSEVEMLMAPRFRGEHIRHRNDYFAEPAVRPMGAGAQLWGLRHDGSEFPVGISLSPLHTEQGLHVLAAIRDVTERYEYIQRLKRQREDLIEAEQQLKTEKERFEAVVGNTPSAISVGDPEHRYTMVNEAFCELVGKESVEGVIGRTEDEILPPDLLRRAQHARARLLAGDSSFEEEPVQRGPKTLSLVTQRFPLRDSAGTITELVTIRTDITHRKKIEWEAAERTKWQERITAAIGDGRLLVYSQPIVDIATKEAVGEELLVRLRASDTEEVLPPSEFLPQCEQHGLMPVIDRYMVGRAIDLARTGRQVSVNITGQTIADATMGEILEALTTVGQEVTNKIIFEITETTALASPATAKAFSVSMRDRGCRVALDDFGTGYGTFTELRHLALHALKIDMSFVQKMLEDRDDERVVNTIVFVAKTYDLTTIAEGVESEEVLNRLAELGADRAQGYLFGKPKPIVA
ncbi:MAG: EAL domain-containing protein [Actinomycetia bacterium]|nr:EAL domain-containing protein [Actinomycetes bacterium]